jgi:hypothetical protein
VPAGPEEDDFMGMSKKDLSRKKANIKARIDELEKKARMDPLKRNRALHDELDGLRKKLAEAE